jgi:hypothetical protein
MTVRPEKFHPSTWTRNRCTAASDVKTTRTRSCPPNRVVCMNSTTVANGIVVPGMVTDGSAADAACSIVSSGSVPDSAPPAIAVSSSLICRAVCTPSLAPPAVAAGMICTAPRFAARCASPPSRPTKNTNAEVPKAARIHVDAPSARRTRSGMALSSVVLVAGMF